MITCIRYYEMMIDKTGPRTLTVAGQQVDRIEFECSTRPRLKRIGPGKYRVQLTRQPFLKKLRALAEGLGLIEPYLNIVTIKPTEPIPEGCTGAMPPPGVTGSTGPKEDYFLSYKADELHPWMPATGSDGLCELCGHGQAYALHHSWNATRSIGPRPDCERPAENQGRYIHPNEL